jgi:hypothetical protein
MEIQSSRPSRDVLADLHTSPKSRREAFRGPSGEEICRMPRLLNRDFVSISIPHKLSGDTTSQRHG